MSSRQSRAVDATGDGHGRCSIASGLYLVVASSRHRHWSGPRACSSHLRVRRACMRAIELRSRSRAPSTTTSTSDSLLPSSIRSHRRPRLTRERRYRPRADRIQSVRQRGRRIRSWKHGSDKSARRPVAPTVNAPTLLQRVRSRCAPSSARKVGLQALRQFRPVNALLLSCWCSHAKPLVLHRGDFREPHGLLGAGGAPARAVTLAAWKP